MPALTFNRTTATYLAIGAVVLLFTVIIPALGVFDTPDVRSEQGETKTGKIERLLDENTTTGPRGQQTTRRFEVSVDGQQVTVEQVISAVDPVTKDFEAGDSVLVTRQEGPNGDVYFLSDHARGFPLWTLAIAFCLFVIAVARWQGAFSLLGMVFSTAIILRFIIPGIVSGGDPVLISVIGALAIMSSSLFLSHGVGTKTFVAFAGTAACLAITALLASFVIGFAKLTGLADEHSITLQIVTGGAINAEGLLLGGIIIGALGVLDDVTVAQASAVFELHRANSAMGVGGLFSRGMTIGRDHIASTVNTLFLAYAGAALPLLIILSLQTEPAGILLNREFLATEIARTIVGSIGIVAAVPITTAIAAWAAQRYEDDSDHGHSHTHSTGPFSDKVEVRGSRERTQLPGTIELRPQRRPGSPIERQ
ncbi:MAG: YibE/F family protein [Dehalococcoidia bacterium]